MLTAKMFAYNARGCLKVSDQSRVLGGGLPSRLQILTRQNVIRLVYNFNNIYDIKDTHNNNINNIKATYLYHFRAARPSLAVGPIHPGEAISQGGTKMLKQKNLECRIM